MLRDLRLRGAVLPLAVVVGIGGKAPLLGGFHEHGTEWMPCAQARNVHRSFATPPGVLAKF